MKTFIILQQHMIFINSERLQYDEKTTMNKSSSSSSLISIHDGKPKKENLKQQSSSMIDKSNDLIKQSNNELSDNESDIDESSSNSNNNSSSNHSNSEDIDFDVYSYQFKIESKHKHDTQKYACNPMIYHLLNDNDIYTHDTNIALNEEYYKKSI